MHLFIFQANGHARLQGVRTKELPSKSEALDGSI
jgi:hypothetical protein